MAILDTILKDRITKLTNLISQLNTIDNENVKKAISVLEFYKNELTELFTKEGLSV